MSYTYYQTSAFSGGWHDGRIGVEVVSQSTTGNYSTVNLIVQAKETTDASSYNLSGATEYIKVDGVSKVSDNSIDFRSFVTGTWYTILSVSNVRIYHTSDGTKTASIQGYCATGVGAGTYNKTASVTLPAIIQKSTATVTETVEVNGTNQCTATITRYDSSYTHTVTFYIGDFATTTYKQEYTSVATSQAYAIPLTWMNAIPNSTSGSAKVRVETFDGATSLGYNEYTFAITVPTTVIPVVTDITFNKVSDAFSAGIYVKGITKFNVVDAPATNQYSATTSWFKAVPHPASYTSLQVAQALVAAAEQTAAFDTAVFSTSGSMKLSAITQDTRTRQSAAYSESFTVYDYSAPSITVTGERCTSAGVLDPNGAYIKVRIQSTVSAVNNDNTADYTLEYKKTTDSSWTSIDVTALADNYSVDSSYVRSASASYSWEVRASVTDKVNTATKTSQVSTGSTVMDFLSGGTGMAIGKVSEGAGLDIAWEIFGSGLNLTEIPFSYNSTAAAATADKGTFDGHVFLGSVIDLILDNGNTAASPTVTIGSVAYSISGLPTVAKLSTSANQTYKVKKTAATTLTFIEYPDYVCERGSVDTSSGDWVYEKWASGKAECWTKHNVGTVAIGTSLVTIASPLALYYGTTSIGHNYPFTFTSITYSNTAHESNGTGYGMLINYAGGGSTSVAPSIGIGRIMSGAANLSNVVLSNITIGTWK